MVQIAARSPDRRREILEAASRVFRQRGLAAAGMRDIAAELDMAVGNLYYYFENKEALLAYCQEDALTGLLRLAARVAGLDGSADTRLWALLAGHVVRLNEGTPGSLAHLEVEAIAPGARKNAILEQRRAYERAVRRLIAEGIDDGIFRSTDPKVQTLALLGAVNWTVKWFRPQGGQGARRLGEQFAETLVRGLLTAGRDVARPSPADLDRLYEDGTRVEDAVPVRGSAQSGRPRRPIRAARPLRFAS